MGRFPTPNLSGRRLPDETYAELVDLLFTPLSPLVIMAVSVGSAGALLVWRFGDPLLAFLAASALILSLIRIGIVVAYRRGRGARTGARAEVMSCERRFAAASMLFALTLGLFNARALFVGYELTAMLVTGLIFGYGAGW